MSPAWRRRLLRWTIHGAVALVGCWALITVARDRIETDTRKAMRAPGPALLHWGATSGPGERTLVLNGADVLVATGVTADPVDAILDEYAARCGASDFLDGEAVGSGHDAALRDDDDRSGFVACAAPALAMTDLESFARLAERPGSAAEEMGGLRYVYAERTGDLTHFVVLWADQLVPSELFPIEGDAPGSDAAPIPRPPDGRRVISAAERGKPYAMAVYVAAGTTPADAARRFQRLLDGAGFEAVGAAALESSAGEISWLVRAGDTFAALAVFPHAGGAGIAVAVAQGGPDPLLEMLGGTP